MISDYVKGKKKYEYPAGIQKGIGLHRAIDTFTDSHEATRAAKAVFRPVYRLYSAAFTDVVYDHFLAIDKNEFGNSDLKTFSSGVYSVLDQHRQYFPEKFARLFPYMKAQNWLYNYHSLRGIELSFGGVVRRSLHLKESATAFQLFIENYSLLQDCYTTFFTDVKSFAYNEFIKLQNS